MAHDEEMSDSPSYRNSNLPEAGKWKHIGAVNQNASIAGGSNAVASNAQNNAVKQDYWDRILCIVELAILRERQKTAHLEYLRLEQQSGKPGHGPLSVEVLKNAKAELVHLKDATPLITRIDYLVGERGDWGKQVHDVLFPEGMSRANVVDVEDPVHKDATHLGEGVEQLAKRLELLEASFSYNLAGDDDSIDLDLPKDATATLDATSPQDGHRSKRQRIDTTTTVPPDPNETKKEAKTKKYNPRYPNVALTALRDHIEDLSASIDALQERISNADTTIALKLADAMSQHRSERIQIRAARKLEADEEDAGLEEEVRAQVEVLKEAIAKEDARREEEERVRSERRARIKAEHDELEARLAKWEAELSENEAVVAALQSTPDNPIIPPTTPAFLQDPQTIALREAIRESLLEKIRANLSQFFEELEDDAAEAVEVQTGHLYKAVWEQYSEIVENVDRILAQIFGASEVPPG